MLTPETHQADEQFLLEEQLLNIEMSVIYQVETRRPTISNREGQNLEPRQTRMGNSA
jgi:hypothetical protein